jgi:hypothetical protein
VALNNAAKNARIIAAELWSFTQFLRNPCAIFSVVPRKLLNNAKIAPAEAHADFPGKAQKTLFIVW